MAIAFNHAADMGAITGTSLSGSFTVSSGSDRLLVCYVLGDVIAGADDVTATYNSVSSSGVVKFTGSPTPGAGRFTYLFYWFGPSAGSNTLAISSVASHILRAAAADYTGVSGGGIDNSAVNAASSGETTLDGTLTPVADGCWIIAGMGNANGLLLGKTGATERANNQNSTDLADTNGPISPPVSTTITLTLGAANPANIIVVSFAPAADDVPDFYFDIIS